MRTSVIKYWSLLFLLINALSLSAQIDSIPGSQEVNLDLLRAPVSPAANLLGISPGQIDRPSDPAAFMASINTASNNFSGLPASYAVDLAPAWLFAGNKIRIEDFLSPKASKSIPQSFVLGLATNTLQGLADTLPDVTRFSAGIKLSVLRGQVSEESRQKLNELGNILRKLAGSFDQALDSVKKADRTYAYLENYLLSILSDGSLSFSEKELKSKPVRERMVQVEDSLSRVLRVMLAGDFEAARLAAETVRINRYGFKLDLSAAMAWDFPDMKFNQGQSSAIAAWISGGYESPRGFSTLAMLRYLYQRELPFPGDDELVLYLNTNALDGGLRLLYSNPQSRFGAGTEVIARQMLNTEEDSFTWRFTLNAEYDVGRNKKLSLVIGRDFDGTLTGDSDLILALNFLMGFGTGKKP